MNANAHIVHMVARRPLKGAKTGKNILMAVPISLVCNLGDLAEGEEVSLQYGQEYWQGAPKTSQHVTNKRMVRATTQMKTVSV